MGSLALAWSLFGERLAYYYSIIIMSPGGNQKCAFRLGRPAKPLGSSLGSSRFHKSHKKVRKSTKFDSRLRGVAFFYKVRVWIRPGSALDPTGSMRQKCVFCYILLINTMFPRFGRFCIPRWLLLFSVFVYSAVACWWRMWAPGPATTAGESDLTRSWPRRG